MLQFFAHFLFILAAWTVVIIPVPGRHAVWNGEPIGTYISGFMAGDPCLRAGRC